MAPRSGSAYIFTGNQACAGRMRQWYVNSWGYWVLYAKSGQIILNVTGQMEAQVAAGQRGTGVGAHGLAVARSVRGWAGLVPREKPSMWSPGRGREGHLSEREAPAASSRAGRI